MHVFSLLVTSYFEFSYHYSLPVNLLVMTGVMMLRTGESKYYF